MALHSYIRTGGIWQASPRRSIRAFNRNPSKFTEQKDVRCEDAAWTASNSPTNCVPCCGNTSLQLAPHSRRSNTGLPASRPAPSSPPRRPAAGSRSHQSPAAQAFSQGLSATEYRCVGRASAPSVLSGANAPIVESGNGHDFTGLFRFIVGSSPVPRLREDESAALCVIMLWPGIIGHAERVCGVGRGWRVRTSVV